MVPPPIFLQAVPFLPPPRLGHSAHTLKPRALIFLVLCCSEVVIPTLGRGPSRLESSSAASVSPESSSMLMKMAGVSHSGPSSRKSMASSGWEGPGRAEEEDNDEEDEEGAPTPPGFSFCSSSSCRFKAFSWASRRPMRS